MSFDLFLITRLLYARIPANLKEASRSRWTLDLSCVVPIKRLRQTWVRLLRPNYIVFLRYIFTKESWILIAIDTISDTPELRVDFLLLQIADKIANNQLQDHQLIVDLRPIAAPTRQAGCGIVIRFFIMISEQTKDCLQSSKALYKTWKS